MAAAGRRREEGINSSSARARRRRKVSKERPALQGPKKMVGMSSFICLAYQRSPDQLNCYICGLGHRERFCPYNYIYGRYDDHTCKGECTSGPEQHRITSQDHHKFLCCFIRVNNMPPGFHLWKLEKLFSPFGPLLMWDVPKFINNTCCCVTIIHMSFSVVVFKNREDGSRAIDKLNGYETGGRKLRVDWVYPSCDGKISMERPELEVETNCLPTPPYITVPDQGGRFQTHLTRMARNISKKRTASRGGPNGWLAVSHFPKFRRFFILQEMFFFQRKIKEEQEVTLVNKMTLMRKPMEKQCATSFWRDPDAVFCSICGDDKEEHLELMCPYNYLSPATYSPCKARLALWGNYTTTPRYKCTRQHPVKEQRDPPVDDDTNSRRLGFMRFFVRVNNLPEQCHPEELAALFSKFGPLRMWHVATHRSGISKGFGGIVFQNRDHADEAIEALNCFVLCDRKLRVDWAYPSLNC